MTQKLNPFSGRQFLDANGDPYSGAKLFTYLEGTSTKQTVTKDEAGTSNHANPIILNSKGEPADVGGSAQAIWQPDGIAIKLVLAPSTDSDPPIAAIASWDNIEGINDTAASGGSAQWVDGTTPTYVNATTFTVTGDQSSTYHVGRRVKTINSGGTIYSTITAVAYTTLTTVTIRNDSGLLDSGLSAVSYGLLSSVNNAIPSNIPTLDNIITNPEVTGGAADAYTVDLKESTYVTGRVYAAQIHADNTGASTINISGLGAKNVKLTDGNDPYAGALQAGVVAWFIYNGTNMVLLNPDPLVIYAGTVADYIKHAALDWANIYANEIGLIQGSWTNYDHATALTNTTPFATAQTMYIYVPPDATTMNYKVKASGLAAGAYYRVNSPTATGTTTTITSTSIDWDSENETVDVSADSGLTLFSVQSYGENASNRYLAEIAYWFE